MPAPFYNAIKAATNTSAGAGSFTPASAAPGFRPWSKVPAGWMGLVRYEEGPAWELSYGRWDGTTITRPANGFVDSSDGSPLSLGTLATAALVPDSKELMSHLGSVYFGWWKATINATTINTVGLPAPVVTGSSSAQAIDITNYRTEQPRVQYTSATTAGANAGWAILTPKVAVYSTEPGRGGFEGTFRFGIAQLPVGPRFFAGFYSATLGSNDPSTVAASMAAFAKDSTDTNIQLLVKDAAGAAAKIDTGIPLAVNGWYEARVWAEPGGGRIYGLLMRIDTGDIWFGSTDVGIPAASVTLGMQILLGLNATNTGTAAILQPGSVVLRNGS